MHRRSNAPMLITTLALQGMSHATARAAEPLFVDSGRCIACHNGISSARGDDLSFGHSWRPSMMANAARDPYWQAAVRRETLDHPRARAAIEDECSACHMPMARTQARAGGAKGEIFAHLAARVRGASAARLALDGVSCASCHQIAAARLGTRESFTGGFVVDTARAPGQRRIFGPYRVERGLQRVMRSASTFEPARGPHLRRSEFCATCHTLFTHARGPGGEDLGTLPEQVPYLEWQHSAYRAKKSCQDCHMPVEPAEEPIASVLGQPREHFSRHVFRGGNFFMPRMLNRYRAERGVKALPQELQAVARRAVDHLQSRTARLQIVALRPNADKLEFEVAVANLAGHKLPTAYPSRRAWLHLTVRDGVGRVRFESGAVHDDGGIEGNDNDRDATRFEPHHLVIERPDQVPIYEAIMVDHADRVTTGLLRGVRFVKDNRVLPRGFDKASASAEVAVRGAAIADGDFIAGGDRVRYHLPLPPGEGPWQIAVELVYQPIGRRWALNLAEVDAVEPRRFVGYYRAMAASSSVVLARASARWSPRAGAP